MKKNCEYKGQTKTLSNWCKELSLDYKIVYKRLLREWSVSEAFETRIIKRKSIILDYKGQKKTLSDWCIELGLDYQVVYSRLCRGWDIAKAFETQIIKLKAKINQTPVKGDSISSFFRCKNCFRLITKNCDRDSCQNWKAEFN